MQPSTDSSHTWHEWVVTELTGKPVGIGAANWLRVRCLLVTKKGAIYGN